MSRSSIASLVLVAALGFSAAAAASEPAPAGSTAQATAVGAQRQAIKPGDRNCLRSTGSLIPPKKGACLPVAGRSYSGRELRNTGAIDNAHALQMLDPSISLGH